MLMQGETAWRLLRAHPGVQVQLAERQPVLRAQVVNAEGALSRPGLWPAWGGDLEEVWKTGRTDGLGFDTFSFWKRAAII